MKAQLSIRVWILAIVLSLVLSAAGSAHADAFLTNSPMNAARVGHCGVLLPNGKYLAIGGVGSNGPLASAELYDPATGKWTTTGAMSFIRANFSATLLMNGKVLVAGGFELLPNSIFFQTNGAELYDPGSGTWTPTGSMMAPRFIHTAILLFNGQVLVTGGVSSGQQIATAELYNPATGSWTNTGSMNFNREYNTLTLLRNGKVLAVGGGDRANTLASVESYDPTTGLWTTNSPLNFARIYHSATLLPNGQVMVAGGEGPMFTPIASVELYDPVKDLWTTTNSMNSAKSFFTTALLPNGSVLVNGTDEVSYTNNAEIFNPATGTWTSIVSQNAGYHSETGALLANGRVIFLGGYESTRKISSSFLYDPTINPATGTFLTNAPLSTARGPTAATLLPNGKVLIVGGWDAGHQPLASTELFDPSSKTWTNSGSLITARSGHTVTLLPNGKVLAVGGMNGNVALNSAELYDPITGTWTNTSPLRVARIEPTATLLPNGKVLVAGGDPGNAVNLLSSAEIYDPLAGTWTPTGPMNFARVAFTATLLPKGQVLVAGGYSGLIANVISSAELYDPATGIWTNTGSLNAARDNHTATLLPNGKVLVAGGNNLDLPDNGISSAEIYDPATGTWTNTSPMAAERHNFTATLLPDGEVLVAGGVDQYAAATNAIPSAELFDPASETWTPTGPLNDTNRLFGVAVLLTNGQVLLAGDENPGVETTELFDAGLGYSNSWQPQITSATSPLALSGSLVLTGAQFRGISGGASGNVGESPADYPVVQLRSLESARTEYLLSTNWSVNSFASLPVTNFPPGYAMVTVFVNGIPSAGHIVNITVPVPTATVLTHFRALANGSFQFAFTNTPGALFGVLTTTNPALPLTSWTALGGVTEISPGQFQFSDSQTENNAKRFYLLRAP